MGQDAAGMSWGATRMNSAGSMAAATEAGAWRTCEELSDGVGANFTTANARTAASSEADEILSIDISQ